MSEALAKFMEKIKAKDPDQPEFHQAVYEVAESLMPFIEANPKYKKANILERMVEPERVIMFRVPWVDDKGEIHVNRAYRVQMNSAIGPYKGGMRFHRNVTLGTLKFLAFEQVFKNALTTLPMGGGKGGSDFDPIGKSEGEVMRFCQSLMMELYRHLGPNTDVPAGDIGVGAREIGFMFGAYKKIVNEWTGVFTGKGRNWGGSRIRPEATGFGVVYFAEEMLKTRGDSMEGKIVAISGFGNVAWGATRKSNDLGAKVVTLSGPDGYIYDPDGVKGEKIDFMLEMRASNRDKVQDYADKFGVQFFPGKRPWEVKADVYMPCAIQNELDINDAKNIVNNGGICVSEGANMPSTPEAVNLFIQNKLLYAPGKASNAGGVSVSGLEMTQNAMHIYWTSEEVDKQLQIIMKAIHEQCVEHGTKDGYTNYVNGSNIAGFIKVADSMIEQGPLS
ncbi:MAG TPA: NADP-specific glutamate dehydrogenase [candidate division Zixibacteria bacterium]|nr:NADP-specific glutamate dehydrogenase [candidate division Zixibacteria bacterium]